MKRRLLSTVCALAILLGMLTVPTFAAEEGTTGAAICGEKIYSSLQAAVDDYTFGVIVLQKDAQKVDIPLNVYLDTNGHNVAGVTVADGATLYVSDTQTDDYTVADGAYGKITGISGAVQAAEGYLAITEEEAVSFHKVDLSLKSMALRPAVAGVYYNSSFAADEVVAANVEYCGVALSVVAEPTEENLETLCGYSVIPGFASGEKSGTLLTGIMDEANTAEENAENAATPVYGRAYIKTSEGYTFGDCVSRDLKTQVEAIDAIFDALTDTQKSGILAMYETYKTAMEDWSIPNLRANQLGNTVITVPVQTENGVVTEEITVEKDGLSITIPFGTLVEKSELTLKVTKKEQSDSGIEAKDDQTLMPFDVHVDGISSENTVPLTVALGKVMPENLNMGNYTIYHVEGDGTKKMALVANDAEFTAHNQYKYTLEGELTLHMATFSEVAVVSETENIWNGTRNYEWYDAAATELYIRNADQLAGFGAIVGNMASVDGKDIAQDSFEGKTVKLLADISIGDLDSENAYVFYPIGYWNNQGSYEKCYGREGVSSGFYAFQGTFDGNGNTISDFYQNTWEMVGDYNDGYSGTPNYYRDGMGLFGKVYGGTVKNLTVRNFSCDSEHGTTGTIAAYADCGAVFENISIFDCNPRVYNIGNGGIVGCSGWYAQETAENKVVFRNISVDQSNKISALWDATGTSAGGILGQYYPTSGQSSAGYPENPGILFENCHTAAIIEVNNDCCSNYHYYWYRYAGMLMGSIRKNTTDGNGNTVADTTGITAVDCTYTYGNWNEYWYCELVKNTIASYTHDHQFGRLTSITDLSEITNDEGKTWLKEGNFALLDENRDCVDCYHIFKDSSGNLYRHFHDVADETNPNIYETFDLNGDGELNDLKEDRQRYYIPFGQLFTGDGMGIKAHHEFPGVTEVKDGTVRAQQKFQVKEGADLAFLPGETVKLSDIVELTAFGESKLTQAFLYAAASPVTEEDTVNVTYYQDVADWTNNTITFSEDSFGLVKLVLTDYFYCEPTVVYVAVGEDAVPAVKFDDILGVTLAQKEENLVVAENTVLSAGQIFQATADNVEGEKVKISVAPADENSTVVPATYTSTAADWASGTLQFKGRGNATVTVTEGRFCVPTTVTVTVDSVKAASDAMDFSAGGTVTAICPACAFLSGQTSATTATAAVDWTAMAAGTVKHSDGTHKHFYLAAGIDYTKQTGLIQFVSNTKGCINLNGQNITSSARVFYAESTNTVLNIMGSGKVTGGNATYVSGNYSGSALDITTRGNLFGGTYTGTKAYPVVSARGAGANNVLNIWEGTVIEKAASATKGRTLFIGDYGTVNMYGGVIRGGTAVNPDAQFAGIAGYGGNIIIKCHASGTTKASFNLYGGEVVGGTASEKGGNIAVYKNGATKSSAVVNIAGGSVTGGNIYLDASNQTLKLTGAPTVSGIQLAEGVLADINGLSTDITPIQVIGDDQVKFTTTITENAEAYEKVFYVDQKRKAVAAVDVDGDSVADQLMIDDTCPHCDVAISKLEWTPITKQTALSVTKQHYRVTQDINHTASSYILRATATEVIVDTNGFDLTSKQRCFYINKNCEIYIFESKGTTEMTSAWTGGEGCILYAEGSAAVANIYDVSMTGSTAGSSCAISGAVGSTINLYGITVNAITVAAATGATWANVRSKGTLNIYGGTFHPVTLKNGLQYSLYSAGGNVTVYDGTFYGRVAAGIASSVRGTLTINGGTFVDVVAGVDTSNSCTVNINGGTVTGTVSASTVGTLNIAGNPVIAQVDLLADQKLNIGEMTDGASVTVNAANDTVVSNALTAENAATYGKYFHALDENLDVTVVTQDSGDKVLQVTDDFCVHCGVSIGDIQWIELNDTTMEELKIRCASKTEYYYLPTGHYKMTGDVSFENQMMIGDYDSTGKTASDVVLDLNGYTVTLDEGIKSRVFYVVNAGSKLTVVDSRPDATHEDDPNTLGGRIIGTSTVGGGSLYVSAGTKVDMYGGTVLVGELAAPSQGGAVYCPGIFNLYGGKVIGTTVSQWGGTFYLPSGYLNVYSGTVEGGIAPGGMGSCIYTSGNAQLNVYGGTVNGEIAHTSTSKAQITLSGAPTVTQLGIPTGKTITVNELTEGARIGVTATAAGVFTNAGAAQYVDYFHVYDEKAFALTVDGDALALTENTVLYAGFNRKSLVPDYEVRLGGGNGVRMATECIDSITASCVALQRGGETYIICTMDFLTGGDGYVVPVQRAVSNATGIPESNIMLHTTHTHSAPYVNGTGWTNDYGKTYREDICRWIAESAVAAVADLTEATASYGSTTASEHAFVRHYEQKLLGFIGESEYFGANFGDSTLEGYVTVGHAGEVDNEMQLIRFARADKQDVLLANFPAHATFNQDATQMSADFPHYFRTYVEANDSDILCAYFIAAAGNQVPTSRLDRETDHTDITDYGNTLGQIALDALPNLTAAQDGDILLSTRTFTGISNIPDDDEYKKALAVKAIWDANGGERTTQEAKDAGFNSIYHVTSVINRHGLSDTRSMEIKTMAIGNMSFVFAPYEMFGSDGRAIKDGNAANHDMTFIITCGEGDEGYLPTDLGWDINSYEANVTMFAKGTNTQLVNEYLAMLAELKAQQSE